MAQKLILRICYLYPDLMDTYGDIGNIIALKKRCATRNIKVEIVNKSLNDKIEKDKFDLFFFGGGQDKIQILVGKDLQKKRENLINSIEKGAVLLSICGGYQLLQKYFRTVSGETIKGIGLFDAHTEGSDERMIQNLWIDLSKNIKDEIKEIYPTVDKKQLTTDLIGFENHSGKTYLGKNLKPLGTVIKGAGNNGEDKTEGAIYKNAFGCYLHGSLLPKNPHFADYLIAKALERRYGQIKLEPLDDSIEWQAHKAAIKRT